MKLINTIIDKFYSEKRQIKHTKRQIKNKLRISLLNEKHAQFRHNFGQRSKVIKMLAKYGNSKIKSTRYKIDLSLGKHFSIMDHPKECISLINAFAKALNDNPTIRDISLKYSNLEQYDLAANALLDIVIVERNTELKSRNCRKKLRVHGNYPRLKAVKLFIKSMGIIKHLDIKHEAPSIEDSNRIRFFDARNSNYQTVTDGRKAGLKDIKIKNFVDYVDGCLQDHSWTLSDLGRVELVNYTGEILANAEEHAGFVDWTIQGYLDKSNENPVCEIAIFNFGQSIADSLGSDNNNPYKNSHIGPYLMMHKAKKFFDHDWKEQDLLTVMALQGNVSRFNKTEKDHRGQGTIDMIRFFEGMNKICAKNHSAKMAILSGSTHIFFDGTYSLHERESAGSIIAFNKNNNLNEKPDSNYVRNLGKEYFPGTIISIKFPITKSSLIEEIVK